MIIRRPYIFFIKNFKKIHILLLILSIIVFLKQSNISAFIKEFLNLKTYDATNFPITKYIPTYLILIVLVLFIVCLILTIILKKKNKPWKLYLIPTITYSVLLLMYLILRSYFQAYAGADNTAEVNFYRDILFFTTIFQYPTLLIFLIRILGLDLRKFNFKTDEEYLELDEDDQEEVEISFNFDKETIRRVFNRTVRNLKYVYQEHKKIFTILIIIISIIILRKSYLFIVVSNKSYEQNEEYNANGYTFVIKDVIYTNKKYNGDIISKKNSFVIVKLNVKNNYNYRKLDTSSFRLLNGINSYNETNQTYGAEFEDFGEVYDDKAIESGKSRNIILIYRVDNKLKTNRFVLVYQELGGENTLRKIKLKMKDLTNINEKSNLNTGDSMKVTLKNKKETISVDSIYIKDKITYKYRECTSENCENISEEYIAPKDKKILVIEYGTEEIDSKDIIDFSTKYGKIIYIDNKGKEVSIPMKNALPRTNKGKKFYSLVPSEITESNKLLLSYTIRNNRYVYNGK